MRTGQTAWLLAKISIYRAAGSPNTSFCLRYWGCDVLLSDIVAEELVVARAAGGFGLKRPTIYSFRRSARRPSRGSKNLTINRESGRRVRAGHPWWEHGRSWAPYDL